MPSQGVPIAVDEINKAGGFKVGDTTYKLDLIALDTRGDPKEATIELKKLLEQDKVKFVFGPFLSNVFITIFPYAKQFNGKFLMIGGGTRIHDYRRATRQRVPHPHLELGRRAEGFRREDGRLSDQDGAPQEGSDAVPERFRRQGTWRHLRADLQGPRHRDHDGIFRARHQGFLAGAGQDRRIPPGLSVPGLFRRGAIRHRAAIDRGQLFQEILPGARVHRTGPEEQGRPGRLHRLCAKGFRGGREEGAQGQTFHRRL